LTGGEGDDTLDGGSGDDVAIFSGNLADYSVTSTEAGLRVVDLEPTINGDDGTDDLIDVETLRFNDVDVTIDVAQETEPSFTDLADQFNPAVAYYGDGGYLVFWDTPNVDFSGKAVVAHRFDAFGTPLGSRFRVNSTTSNDQTVPRRDDPGRRLGGRRLAVRWAGRQRGRRLRAALRRRRPDRRRRVPHQPDDGQ